MKKTVVQWEIVTKKYWNYTIKQNIKEYVYHFHDDYVIFPSQKTYGIQSTQNKVFGTPNLLRCLFDGMS